MSELTKYQPRKTWLAWPNLGTLHDEMDRMLENFFTPGRFGQWTHGEWQPTLDIYESEDKFTVTAELPGMKKKDIKLAVEGNTLLIKGERKQERKVDKEYYHQTESYLGSFSRSLELPGNIEAEKITAHYKDGVLEMQLPKTSKSKPKQIEIKEH